MSEMQPSPATGTPHNSNNKALDAIHPSPESEEREAWLAHGLADDLNSNALPGTTSETSSNTSAAGDKPESDEKPASSWRLDWRGKWSRLKTLVQQVGELQRPRLLLAIFALVLLLAPLLGVGELIAQANRQAGREANISQAVLALQQMTAQLRQLTQGEAIDTEGLLSATQRFASATRRIQDYAPRQPAMAQEDWQAALSHLRDSREHLLRFVEQATQHRQVLAVLPQVAQRLRSNADQLARQGESLIALALNAQHATPEQLLALSQIPSLAQSVANKSDELLRQTVSADDVLSRARKDVNTLVVILRGLLTGDSQTQLNKVSDDDLRAAVRKAADLANSMQGDLNSFETNLLSYQRLRGEQLQLGNQSQSVLDTLSRISTLGNTTPWWQPFNSPVLGLSALITLLALLGCLWQWRLMARDERLRANDDFVNTVITAVESLSRMPAADETAEQQATEPVSEPHAQYAVVDRHDMGALAVAMAQLDEQTRHLANQSRGLHMDCVNLLLQRDAAQARKLAQGLERQAQGLAQRVDLAQASVQELGRVMRKAGMQAALDGMTAAPDDSPAHKA